MNAELKKSVNMFIYYTDNIIVTKNTADFYINFTDNIKYSRY